MHEAVDSRQTECEPLLCRAIVKPLALAIGVAQLIARYWRNLSDMILSFPINTAPYCAVYK
jgi:hypothetical protein